MTFRKSRPGIPYALVKRIYVFVLRSRLPAEVAASKLARQRPFSHYPLAQLRAVVDRAIARRSPLRAHTSRRPAKPHSPPPSPET